MGRSRFDATHQLQLFFTVNGSRPNFDGPVPFHLVTLILRPLPNPPSSLVFPLFLYFVSYFYFVLIIAFSDPLSFSLQRQSPF